jgi:hypothetical protein
MQTVLGIPWIPCAPGPDPRAVLKGDFSLNGTRIALKAYRVPMAHAMGWTNEDHWDLTEALLDNGVAWDLGLFRDYVRRIESLGGRAEDEEYDEAARETRITLDPAMQAEELKWKAFVGGLGQSVDRFSPAMIDGASYLILGFSSEGEPTGPRIDVAASDSKLWADRGPGELHIGLRIEGMPGALDMLAVRTFGLRNSMRVTPVYDDEASRAWIEDTSTVGEALHDIGEQSTARISGRSYLCMLTPTDEALFEFDVEQFQSGIGMPGPNAARHRFRLPNSMLDDKGVLALAALAELVESRSGLANLNGKPVLATKWEKMEESLRLPEGSIGKDRSEVMKVIGGQVGRTKIDSLFRDDKGQSMILNGDVAEFMLSSNDSFYLALSPLFVFLAERGGATLAGILAAGGTIETDWQDDLDDPMEWVRSLPKLNPAEIKRMAELLQLSPEDIG